MEARERCDCPGVIQQTQKQLSWELPALGPGHLGPASQLLSALGFVERDEQARRDKKVFLSDQCKEIEENNRMGKTRDLFKKIRDTKGTFHAKMGSVMDRNGPKRSRRY